MVFQTVSMDGLKNGGLRAPPDLQTKLSARPSPTANMVMAYDLLFYCKKGRLFKRGGGLRSPNKSFEFAGQHLRGLRANIPFQSSKSASQLFLVELSFCQGSKDDSGRDSDPDPSNPCDI